MVPGSDDGGMMSAFSGHHPMTGCVFANHRSIAQAGDFFALQSQ
jgi:hypothetical protein